MKFYRDKVNADFYWEQIVFKKLNAIYFNTDVIAFYKDGLHHNSKNAAFIFNNYRGYFLDGKDYEYHDPNLIFTKQSWRRLIKMTVFL